MKSLMDPQSLAEPNTILRGLVGSTVHGLSVSDQDDRDEMGICVEPWEHFFGLRERFQQWTSRTQPEGVRSGPGDLDLVVYSLAKWARLALAGNPTILLLLFTPEHQLVVQSDLGRELRANVHWFIGDEIYERYLGYMRQQRHRLTNKVKIPSRPELVARYGYDTKYAGHLLRLGYQGLELTGTGRLSLPMLEPVRSHIVDVRTGKVSEADVLAEATEIEAQLVRQRNAHPLGPANVAAVERFVIQAYLRRHPK